METTIFQHYGLGDGTTDINMGRYFNIYLSFFLMFTSRHHAYKMEPARVSESWLREYITLRAMLLSSKYLFRQTTEISGLVCKHSLTNSEHMPSNFAQALAMRCHYCTLLK